MQLKRIVAPVGLLVIVAGVVLALGNRLGYWKTFPLAGTITIFIGFILNRLGRSPS